MSRPQLNFWFDFASTYSHPAAQVIGRRAADAGVEVVWRPFLLGPLFEAQQGLSDSPFNVQLEKGAYMWRDLERTCARLKVAFSRPTVFPRNSLHAARATLACAAEGLDPAAFVRALFDANFVRDWDIADPTVLGEILVEIDYDAARVLERARGGDIKADLKASTEEAAAKGLFGAPSFTAADGELFWGVDRMDEALAWAAEH